MPLGVPWSKSMRIGKSRLGNRNRRGVKAAGGKLKHGLNLFSGYMELLDDLLDARPRLEVFKHRSNRHPGTTKYPCAAAPLRHAFDGWTLRPIKSCHIHALTLYCKPFAATRTRETGRPGRRERGT